MFLSPQNQKYKYVFSIIDLFSQYIFILYVSPCDIYRPNFLLKNTDDSMFTECTSHSISNQIQIRIKDYQSYQNLGTAARNSPYIWCYLTDTRQISLSEIYMKAAIVDRGDNHL